ncbi:hypothetical protein [Corynebacterium uterequi]|uniref:Uncharacterized protein n=1 Tax=Corynebacterium uterequi TaxID=1072256 RepID=A0A0G3HEI2_9CORY|nr:hypothetical protein [Corynebacterium uterequi]AKK11110.1 hypothetical protein CUTER_05570 [Corynebacterium uterequi]
MDIRAEVWSPLQNAAVWLTAWLYGHESTDELVDAWRQLGYSTPVEVLAAVRDVELSSPPVVRLVLSGPGHPSGLPGGRREAIVVGERLVLCPEWEVVELDTELPAPEWLSPGDADRLLTEATNRAADLIEATGYRSTALGNPRLTVGTLTDFYGIPGLPSSVPPRAAKLFARADVVAAIIETVTEKMGDHSVDPQLLALWRHIRIARMAGVTYAAVEFAR